ncbi:unnamed protein product [Commensalibacter communis]|uniref:Uncharacterized protein n=1 Tax=Commensalibacter communis TaxID=2972786 RepID=A0A9W4TS74_9PROT|nr:hypothetical protein [Commensalibacter communis]CAI3960601.1 unnamed protein product [Commensalibacter communis]CAI3962128.1 unnamed protein product [Commensalibacter communis]
MVDKVWLNKKELRERFGGVSNTVINNLIEKRGFPKSVPLLDNISNYKWYLPSIEEWERKEVIRSMKPQKDSDLMKDVKTPDVALRESKH